MNLQWWYSFFRSWCALSVRCHFFHYHQLAIMLFIFRWWCTGRWSSRWSHYHGKTDVHIVPFKWTYNYTVHLSGTGWREEWCVHNSINMNLQSWMFGVLRGGILCNCFNNKNVQLRCSCISFLEREDWCTYFPMTGISYYALHVSDFEAGLTDVLCCSCIGISRTEGWCATVPITWMSYDAIDVSCSSAGNTDVQFLQ